MLADASDNLTATTEPFLDDFEDGNATDWSLGTGWSASTKVIKETNAASTRFHWALGHGDVDIRFRYMTTDTTAGLFGEMCFRTSSTNALTNNTVLRMSTDGMKLQKVVAGVVTVLDSEPSATATANTWYPAQILAKGSNVTVWRGEGNDGPGPLPRYTGHLWEGAAGLHLAPYRAYAPTLARWLSRDPLGMVDGPNVYAYVAQNPVSAFDRQGLAACGPWVPCDLYNKARCEVSCLATGGTYKTCLMQTCVVGHRWGKKCIRIIINGCTFKLCHPWPIPILKTKYVCTCHGTGRQPMPRFPDL